MICPNCGTDSDKNVNFCVGCGGPLLVSGQRNAEETQTNQAKPGESSGLIGYSERINDPAFASYQRQTTAWSFIFAGILTVVVIIGFFIYGETSPEMDNPQALFIGVGIGGMFLTIALLSVLSRRMVKQWDGVVIDKKIENKTRRNKDSDGQYYAVRYKLYTVVFKTDRGKILEKGVEDDDTVFNYFEIGDQVRQHKGLGTLEKYDKSRDSIIFCNACSTLNDINDDKCHRCSCPLLK
ncbi:MAG: hypothetical protein GXY50_00905 [Syntrophomonadaceae bacterium]|nr:hypothetical protein [Syntrophomonadaceae bacterium]